MNNFVPLIVNLIGQPGAGKSTLRAGAFHLMKMASINCEEVTEFAKDLTWEKRNIALSCQPYVFGKQLRNLERLFGQVDVIITDSPLILSCHYAALCPHYSEKFSEFVVEQYKRLGGLNYFVKRVQPYSSHGRYQTEDEADFIGKELHNLLINYDIDFTEIEGNEQAPKKVLDDVIKELSSV